MNGKKIIVPVVALMLCAVTAVGIGYAYTGTYSDTSSSSDMDVHWVKVGSDNKIAINTSSYKVDVDTVTKGYGKDAKTTYTLSPDQTHNGIYDANAKTVTFKNVKIGTLTFEASESGATTGTLSITLDAAAGAGNVKIALVSGTPTTFTVGQNVDVYVDITVYEAAVESGASTVQTPVFTMNVIATAE